MNLFTFILVVFLAAASIAEAKGNGPFVRRTLSKGGKSSSYSMSTPSKGSKSPSKSGKGSYSMPYSKSGKSPSFSKSGKGTKGSRYSHSYSMSYPSPCSDEELTVKNCVIYIVATNGKFQQQSITGKPLGEYDTLEGAISDVTENREYVPAPAEEQEEYSVCWEGPGTLVTDPVYFPPQSDCGDVNFL